VLEQEAMEQAMHYYKLGYRQISRRFGIIARVDIPEEVMVELFISKSLAVGGTRDKPCGVACCNLKDQRDYYRRCISKDVIENVPEQVMSYLRKITNQNRILI